jgi:REP element-mobilizing transposase RayT
VVRLSAKPPAWLFLVKLINMHSIAIDESVRPVCYALNMAKMNSSIETQLEMFAPKVKKRRRGSARGGRPPKGPRSSERHEVRATVTARTPVHVVMRCVTAVGRLRKRHIYKAIWWATIAIGKRHDDCRIIHASIQSNHLHLIVEATDRMRLARGMQAFQISAAQRINRAISARSALRRRGREFADRYHTTILTSPRQVRHALAYVLNNWRHHGEDRDGVARGWSIDLFSSGVHFNGWKERATELFAPELPLGYQPMLVWLAKSWLLTTGWRRHGLIGFHEIPKGSR